MSEEILENYPEYNELSERQQTKIIRKTLKAAVSAALPKVRIPTPPNPFKRAIQELRYKRTSLHYRKTHKPINYELWNWLYQFKRGLSQNRTNSQLIEFGENSSASMTSSLANNQNDIVDSPLSYFDTSSNYLGKERFFKLRPEKEEIFASPTAIKEKLELFNSQLIHSIQDLKVEQKEIKESLFELYELSTYLFFIEQLEIFSKIPKNKNKTDKYVKDCYYILRNYYFNWLKKHGIKISRKLDVEKKLLQFQQFRKLDPDHPLVEGFVKLHSNRIDLQQISISLDKEKVDNIFNRQEHSTDSEMRRFDQDNLDKSLLGSEILRFIFKNNGKVAEKTIKKTFLRYPISVKSVLEHLISDGLISKEKENERIIIKLNTIAPSKHL